jgi:hypothetical protein
MRQFVVATAMTGATIGLAHAGCATTPYTFSVGVAEVSSQWRVERDSLCKQDLRSYNGTMSFTSFTVAKRPKHGAVGTYAGFSFAYKPNAGFVGADSFAVLMKFNQGGADGQTLISVSVNVADKS